MPFIDSTPIIHDAEALRRRFTEQGYLFFRKLLPREPVLALGEQLIACCRRHGFFESNPVDDEGKMDLERIRTYFEEAYRLRDLHAVPRHPAILSVYSRLFGRPAVPHARTSLRTIPCGTNQVWPVHQDYLNIGTHDEVWNTWLPVGDCPRELGALWILPGSHKLGVAGNRRLSEAENFFEASGDLFEHPPDGLEWATDDLECGDVVMFNGMTYHRGAPNLRPGEIRLSVDNCVQPVDTDFIPSAFDVHSGDFGIFNQGVTWDDVYSAWPEDDPLRYYWHALDLRFADALALDLQHH